jgi:hypothetical protein
MPLNAGIVTLEDGTPCIVYDEKLPHAVSHVEFNGENHQITLVYAQPGGARGHEFAFPLDRVFLQLLQERGNVAVAYLNDRQVVEINVFPVKFVAV